MKHLSIISVFFISIVFTNCNKPIGCGETRGLETSSFGISIFNTATNDYMYPREEFQSSFKKDSLQVYTDGTRGFNAVGFALEQDPRNPLKGYYAVGFSPIFFIPEDNDAFTQEKTKKIYLQYNYNTVDTLTLVFKAYKDKCGKGQYEYLRVYYKGSIIASVNHIFYATFNLNH